MYDVIIIGGGPAGISASLYAKRGNLKVLVIHENVSSLDKAEKIENYYGFKNGIGGKELYIEGIKQAQNIGVEIRAEEVLKLEIAEKGFVIKTKENEYNSSVVILATGNKKNKPNIKGIDKFEGRGVSYCAVCDGFFYRNKNITVIGNGDYAISETNELINIANKITILTNGKEAPEFRADNVSIDTRSIESIEGENRAEKIQFKDGNNLEIDGIFVAQGVAGSTEFAKKIGAMTNKDKIMVNEKMETNVKGLYACGDCTGGLLQISKAVYEGTVAGLEAIKYVKSLN